ncbi:MAG TPA: glutaredoxin family protein [Solirubrobacterales bacterium]|nr:glutaredoxin family protein [Solirubrobacterales bacterium]
MTAEVVLYGRPDCHLCEEARELLADLLGSAWREVDIDSDDALLRTYLERIPVIEVDGRTVSELVPDADAIREALRGGVRRTEPSPRRR